jgi:hypothetical protein
MIERLDEKVEHIHKWSLDMSAPVIDTAPPLYLYECECGAVTHHPETGRPCDIGHYGRRKPEPA